jgi:hypothetical protein
VKTHKKYKKCSMNRACGQGQHTCLECYHIYKGNRQMPCYHCSNLGRGPTCYFLKDPWSQYCGNLAETFPLNPIAWEHFRKTVLKFQAEWPRLIQLGVCKGVNKAFSLLWNVALEAQKLVALEDEYLKYPFEENE